MIRRLLPALLLAAVAACGRGQPVAALAAAAGPSKPPAPGIAIPDDAADVRTAAVTARPVTDPLVVAARIQADPARVVRVFAPLAGRLLEMTVHPGDRVRQGDTLAVVESSDLAAARADYQKAKVAADKAARALERATILFENQVLPEKDYLEARADAETSRSDLKRAGDNLRILGVDPDEAGDRITVHAPRAGAVLDVGAAQGELSKSLDSPAPLCTVANLDAVWVVGDVYEKDLMNLSPGAPVEVTVSAYPGEIWRGRVASLADTIDPSTRTLKVRVTLPNVDHRLKPEMFASIRVLRAAAERVVIPPSAVLRDGATSSVFVRQPTGRYERRPIVLGQSVENGVEVMSGLQPGDVIVVEGAALLRPGAV